MSELTVLGADWCTDCRRSKRLLDRLGVSYTWVDLVTQPERVGEVLERNAGAHVIPVVIFPDGSHVSEPTDRALTDRLISLGLAAA